MTVAKSTWLKVVNPVLLLSFLVQAFSGLFQRAMPYELFAPVHRINGYLLVACAAIHLYLNWDWVKRVLLRRR